MFVIPKIQVLYRRQDDILFGWFPAEKTEVKYYNIYSSSTATGIFSLFKSNIKNQIDRNYKGKVVFFLKDIEVPIPLNSRCYFKITCVDFSDIESDINLSPICCVYPPNVDFHFEGEAQEANTHNFAWVEENQRWEKILLSPDGKLKVDAEVNVGNVTIDNIKIAAKPDGVTLDYLLIDNQRRVVVTNDPNSLTRITDYQESSGILQNIETEVFSYTNLNLFFVEKLICSGTSDAKFRVKINGETIATLRNSFYDRNCIFDFSNNSLLCLANSLITVTIEHRESQVQDFEVTFLGFLKNI